jgi:two-component system response regulator WspF
VDVLFTSLAEHCLQAGVAVLLTGMGRDGAEGMRRLRVAGWHTIAQDQASSVVYGMPKAAVQLGAVCKSLPIGEVAQAISDQIKRIAAAR